MIRTQILEAQFRDGTFTDRSNLANALLIKPEISDYLVYAFGKNRGEGYGKLQYLLNALGHKGSLKNMKKIGTDEFEWALMGHDTRAVPIADVGNPAPIANVGMNFATFVVPFEEKYFTLGDVLLFGGGMPDQRLVRVQEEPYQSGNAWCYTLALITSDPTETVNPDYLAPGKEVGWVGTAFEEGSEGGGMKEATPMRFRNQMSIQRMAYGMTGTAKNTVLVLRFMTEGGKRKDLWAYNKQYNATYQAMCATERMLWLGKYNRLQDSTIPLLGANGRVVMQGSGIEEQITGSNVIITDQLTEEILKFMLLDLADHDVTGSNRMLFTGKGGLVEFDRALKLAANNLNVTISTSKGEFINKKTGNTLEFGSQFTTYRGFLGTTITVVHHPMFDDPRVFTELHPTTNLTMQSYKMYFIEMGEYDGQPNVQLLTRGVEGESRQFVQWFTAGATTPNFDGNTGVKTMRSNGFDGFMCYMLWEMGIKILNPLSCGMIQVIPPINV